MERMMWVAQEKLFGWARPEDEDGNPYVDGVNGYFGGWP